MKRVSAVYLKKADGPRAVTLPDGSVMSVADLPPPETCRWVVSRKLAVVRGVAHGLISEADALKRYDLSEEEFREWIQGVMQDGAEGLKATLGRSGKN